MDEKGRTRGTTAAGRPRSGVRMALGVAGLGVMTIAMSGCASLAVEKAIGRDPRSYPPVVEAYEWAGRRGDELVVVYRVWGGHPRGHETRWTAINLGTAGWTAGLAATRVGELGDRDSTEAVPVAPLFGPIEQEVALARYRSHPAAFAPIAVYGRGGATPELVVVTRDAPGQLRSAA